MRSDLKTLFPTNVIIKYADDINILVPQYCDIDLAAEFHNIQCWARRNQMTINLSKTKEIVFRRTCPFRYHIEPSIDIYIVNHIKIFGVILHLTSLCLLSFELHMSC